MKLYVFGDTHYAELASALSASISGHELAGFTLDKDFVRRDEIQGYPVIPFEDLQQSASIQDIAIFVAVGYRDMRAREIVYNKVHDAGFRLPNIVAEGAHVAPARLYAFAFSLCFSPGALR